MLYSGVLTAEGSDSSVQRLSDAVREKVMNLAGARTAETYPPVKLWGSDCGL
jgi:hypothetical protein